DEATEGLAPLTRQEIWDRLAALKRDGLSILIIDKTIEALLALADRHVILEKGRIVWSGTSRALAADPVTRDRYPSLRPRVGQALVSGPGVSLDGPGRAFYPLGIRAHPARAAQQAISSTRPAPMNKVRAGTC